MPPAQGISSFDQRIQLGDSPSSYKPNIKIENQPYPPC
jgi:hypothetical protein